MKSPVTLLILSLSLLIACSDKPDTHDRTDFSSVDSTPPEEVVNNGPQYSINRNSGSVGQIVYVPVYSHIYQQNGQKTFNLTATLSIRNTDIEYTITLSNVSYYDSKGNLIQHYVQQPEKIQSLASTYFVVEEEDLRGGVGANFIVKWQSDHPVSPPVIEAVMISTSQQQGLSFLSTGRILEERKDEHN